MHGLTDIIVATEREREVADSSADVCTREIFLYPSGSFNKIYSIVIMFFNPRSYSKHIGVKNNIVRIKTNFVNQKTVSPLANFDFTGGCICLSFLVERHDHSSGSILPDDSGMFKESFLPLFQRNRVDN